MARGNAVDGYESFIDGHLPRRFTMAAMEMPRILPAGLWASVLFFVSVGTAAAQAAPATSASPQSASPAAGQVTCAVRSTPLSDGEKAMIRHDLPKAESLLREEMAKAGPQDSSRLHDELIRTLLRDQKLDAAQTDAETWFQAEPRNGWAEISLAEVQWRKGLVSETYTSIVAASKLDPCNPRYTVDLGQIFRFSGLNATAKKQFDRAHRLDPIDDDISDDWLRYQPRDVKLASLTTYLAQSDFLSGDDRKSLEHYKDELSAPPVPNRCHLAGSVESTTIPFRQINNGPSPSTIWGLDVSLNGKQRRLEVDTGAHGLLLTRSAASALHLAVEERAKTWGIGDEGAVSTQISRVNSIKIGSLEFQDCTVEILDKNPGGLSDIDGLIGGDVFSSFLLTLDFPGHVLKLDPLPKPPDATNQNTPELATGASTEDQVARDRYIDPSMKNWAKVFRAGHNLILPVNLNKSPARLFIVDTGSALNLVSWQTAKQFAGVSKGSDIRLRGISGEVDQTYTTGPITIYFAGLRQESNGLVGMDTSAMGRSIGVDIAGFLGTPVLHVLTLQIDYRDDLVNFTYDPKRLTHCVENVNLPDCVQ